MSVCKHWLWLSHWNPSKTPAAHCGCWAPAMAGHHVANDGKTCKFCDHSDVPAASCDFFWSHFASCCFIPWSPELNLADHHLHSKNIVWKKSKSQRQSVDTKHALSHSAHAQWTLNAIQELLSDWRGLIQGRRISPLYLSFFVVLVCEDSRKVYLDWLFSENALNAWLYQGAFQEKSHVNRQRSVSLWR